MPHFAIRVDRSILSRVEGLSPFVRLHVRTLPRLHVPRSQRSNVSTCQRVNVPTISSSSRASPSRPAAAPRPSAAAPPACWTPSTRLRTTLRGGAGSQSDPDPSTLLRAAPLWGRAGLILRLGFAKRSRKIVSFAETCADCPKGRVEASSASWMLRTGEGAAQRPAGRPLARAAGLRRGRAPVVRRYP
jgi:hypothetical protein